MKIIDKEARVDPFLKRTLKDQKQSKYPVDQSENKLSLPTSHQSTYGRLAIVFIEKFTCMLGRLTLYDG